METNLLSKKSLMLPNNQLNLATRMNGLPPAKQDDIHELDMKNRSYLDQIKWLNQISD